MPQRKSKLQPSSSAEPQAPRPIGCSRIFVNTETGEQYDIDEYPQYHGVPARVDAFIDNKAYRRKYAAMIRQGQLPYLLALADKSETKVFPANYFAKCASKENWPATRAWLIRDAQKYRPEAYGTIPHDIERHPLSIGAYAGPGDEVYIPNIPLHVHAQRFWSKTDHADAWYGFPVIGYPHDCITWTGKPDKDGYGRFSADGRTYAAHRFVYELTHGTLPENFQVDHKCRNRLCVNPDHLEAVTQPVNLSRRQYSPSPAKVSFPAARELPEAEQYRIRQRNRAARSADNARQEAHQREVKRKARAAAEQGCKDRIRGEIDDLVSQAASIVFPHFPDRSRDEVIKAVKATVERDPDRPFTRTLPLEDQLDRAREALAYNQDKYEVSSYRGEMSQREDG
jgi:hypothetical protein